MIMEITTIDPTQKSQKKIRKIKVSTFWINAPLVWK